MKMVKKASGKTVVKMSKSEWIGIGKKAGWIKESRFEPDQPDKREDDYEYKMNLLKEKKNKEDLVKKHKDTSDDYLKNPKKHKPDDDYLKNPKKHKPDLD